jgi:hypothetical protein
MRVFSTLGFRDGKLAVVTSVRTASGYADAKRIIGTTKTLTPEEGPTRRSIRELAKRRGRRRHGRVP